ncbi:MAG TPA: hypothetical protein QGH56_04645 [Candidatus Marinimicrobia bacterium]|nr:hypothetical protein [Candidatus Neomarinimicrobiota bacterium]
MEKSAVNSTGYLHLGGDIRNIYILLLLSLSYSATLLVPSEYSTIQSAIDASSSGDTVLVSAGTYFENINFNGKNIAVIGEDRENTIIDGGQNGSVVTFDSIEGTASALSNFTITGGNAYDGGGIYCSSSAPTIKDNIITGNVSETYGGGISCNYSSPIIMNNTITSNSAIYGGGISFDRYTSSVIKGNNINGNSAEEGGGIGCFTFSSPTITNNTIAGNSASTNGGGIYCYYISSPSVTNTIIWDNTAPTDPNISVYFSDPFFNYSDIEGGWEGDGNIDADPLFCDPENGDLTVQSDSPVLGAGQDGADMGAYGVGCEPDDVCSACNIYYTDGYPGFCCDMAWDEGGLTCLYVEAEWGLDCGGCNCFGDLAFCEDQGLVMCSDYSCAESLSQCPPEYDIELHIQDFEEDGTFELILVNYTDLVAFEFDIPGLSEPDWEFSDNFPTDGWMWAGYWLFYNLYNTPLPIGIYEINASGDLFNNEFCVDGSVFSNSTGEQITNVFFSECAFVECSNPGDINYDGAVDILDIVGFVNDILNPWISNELFHVCGDINEDDEYNILDIVQLVNIILGN